MAGPRLRRLAAAAEHDLGARVTAGLKCIHSTWVDQGLPFEQVDLKQEGRFSISIDLGIVERAAAFASGRIG